MSNTLRELDAYYALLNTWSLARPVHSPDDLNDGVALSTVLSSIDPEYFPTPSDATLDSWVLRFTALKRLYRLMMQYLSDSLNLPADNFQVPDLQAIAKDADLHATLLMCRLAITIAVRCENNEQVIQKIQELSTHDQGALMEAMQKVTSKQPDKPTDESNVTEDDRFYQTQSDRSRVRQEKEALDKVYQELVEEHRILQASVEDLTAEKEDALSKAQQATQAVERHRDDGRAEPNHALRGEIDRLRTELQKSEEHLAAAENELQRQTDIVTDLTRASEELQIKADGYDKLKDQLDEYKHAAEKAQRQENVMEKYKKKLQEGADLRQQLKSLEKQNADLVDKNAALEEDYRKVVAFRPLMDTYKGQIAELEARTSQNAVELDNVRFELEQTKSKLRGVEAEKARDAETLELYQERVRELELAGARKPPTAAAAAAAVARAASPTSTDAISNSADTATAIDEEEEDVDELDAARSHGLGGELDDALSGTTTTDLKLQIGKLRRELEAAKSQQAEASRVLVLENLLDDARRMKTRYEQDYLAAQREKLKLQSDLEEIRSGKALGDGAEAAIALRQRLNETVDELDVLRKEHAVLDVKFDAQSKELTIAKSDLNLVNKDQLEILATLRESVNEDKAGLEAETSRLEKQVKDLADKNRMQLEQINGLLLEKVNLQTEGIGQREKMLQRERDLSDLRTTMSGRDIPEDIKSRLLGQHEDNVTMQEQVKTLNAQLLKARQFIKQQDKLYKEQYGSAPVGMPSGGSQEVSGNSTAQVAALEAEKRRLQTEIHNIHQRYRREFELMLSSVHNRGMQDIRAHLGTRSSQSRPEAKSWLAQQRKLVGQALRV